jgi:hypothetical protein
MGEQSSRARLGLQVVCAAGPRSSAPATGLTALECAVRARVGPHAKEKRMRDGPSGRMQRMHSKTCKLSLLFSEAILKNFVLFSISIQFELMG